MRRPPRATGIETEGAAADAAAGDDDDENGALMVRTTLRARLAQLWKVRIQTTVAERFFVVPLSTFIQRIR